MSSTLRDLVIGSAIWRDFLEKQATENASLAQAVNLLTPAVYLQAVMTKAFAGLTHEAAEVGVGDCIVAAREVAKLLAHTDDDARWAKVHAQQAKIIEAFRSLPVP